MEFRNFIGGEWRETAAASANINPSDISDVIGYAAESDAAEIDHAVGAAKAAALSWSASTPQQRFDVLDFIGSELLARKDDLGHLLAREEGKTLAEGIAETTVPARSSSSSQERPCAKAGRQWPPSGRALAWKSRAVRLGL